MAKASSDGMFYEVLAITPAMAQELMAGADTADTGSAPYRARIDFYADTMASGLWRLNGDTIVVSSAGVLLDGRARLLACIKANVAFPGILVRNVDARALITIDAHVKRSARDILTVKDDTIPASIASAWPIVVGYINAPDRTRFRPHGKASVTPLDIVALAERYPEVTRCAERIRELKLPRKGMDLPAPVAAAALYLFRLANPTKADQFFEVLADEGADDRAVTTLRRVLRDPEGHHHSNTARLALLVKTWNKFVDGKPITTKALRYDGIVERIGGTSGQELFPTISGFPFVEPFDIEEVRRLDGIEIVGKPAAKIARQSKVRIRRIFVTPTEARGHLEKNGPMGRNRSLRGAQVKRLADDMVEGRWVFNGKPLKFTRDGTLLDGQHRCSAGVRSGVTFETLVIEGLEPTDFATYDQGRRQNAANKLSRKGIRYGTQQTACATTLWRMERNLVSGEPSPSAAMAIIERHPKLGESVQLVEPYKHIVQTGVSAALHTVFADIDEAQADEFMMALCKGTRLGAGHPVLDLRRRFIEQRSRKVKLPVHAETIRDIIVTWNRFRGHDAPFEPVAGGANYPTPL